MSNLSAAILALAPKGYWRGNDARGSGTAADSSGNSHTGTLRSATKAGMPGVGQALGTAIKFDGSTSNLNGIDIANHADFNTLNMSFVCAIRMDQHMRTINLGMLYKSGTFWNLGFSQGAGKQTMKFDVNGLGTVSTATTDITDTNKFHLCVWTVATSYTTAKMYLDGVDVTGALTNLVAATNTNGLSLGADYQPAICQDMAFFDFQLSPAQVAALTAAFNADNVNPSGSPRFGIHNDCMYQVVGTIDSQIATDAAEKAKLSRSTLRFDIIQPTGTGGYDWTITDEIVKQCLQKRIVPVWIYSGTSTAVNGGTNRASVPGTGVDATFITFVTKMQTDIAAFVDRYKPGGSGPYTLSELIIEMWNEPNLGNPVGPSGFWINTAAGGPDPNQYAYWYRNVRTTILAHYAGTRVLLGGLSSWSATGAPNQSGEAFLRAVIGSAQWSAAPIDYAAYHPYSNGDNPNDTTPFQNHFNDILSMRCVLAELGYTPPIWISEVGVRDTTSQADQAAKINGMMTRFRDEWSSWAQDFVYFCDADTTAANYGLYTSMPSSGAAASTPKTAAATFQGIAAPFFGGGSRFGGSKFLLLYT